jgi:hypothetical protein
MEEVAYQSSSVLFQDRPHARTNSPAEIRFNGHRMLRHALVATQWSVCTVHKTHLGLVSPVHTHTCRKLVQLVRQPKRSVHWFIATFHNSLKYYFTVKPKVNWKCKWWTH